MGVMCGFARERQDPKQIKKNAFSMLGFTRDQWAVFIFRSLLFIGLGWVFNLANTIPVEVQQNASVLALATPSLYQPMACRRVTEKLASSFAARLVLTAQHHNYSTLTAYHVGEPACIIVTSVVSGKWMVYYNPRLTMHSGELAVQQKSILCHDTTINRAAQTLAFVHNTTEIVECPDVDCAMALSHAFQLLEGKYRCK